MRIVIKVGSKLVSSTQTPSGLDETFIGHLVQQIGVLHHQEHYEIVLVTSGAVAVGMIGEEKDYSLTRAAMVGQVKLMATYLRFFGQLPQKIRVGQALYTYNDLKKDNKSYVREAGLLEGFRRKEITIVNANDATMRDELQELTHLADNDRLAAWLATLIDADLLLILTDIDGLYSEYGTPHAQVVQTVPVIDDEILRLARDTDNKVSKGGMGSKVEVARFATSCGIEVGIMNGRIPNILLERTYIGSKPGTTFLPQSKKER